MIYYIFALIVVYLNKHNNTMKIVSVGEILAAGGTTQYAKTIGIDTSKKRLSGGIRMSKAETLKALEELSKQK